jgi:hypothetical protein
VEQAVANEVLPFKRSHEMSANDEAEVAWHRGQIAKNQTILEELEAGNAAGGDVFPETQAEIGRIKAQMSQSGLIVAAYEKERNDPQ